MKKNSRTHHARLVQSHWDFPDDEFINLSLQSTISKEDRSQSNFLVVFSTTTTFLVIFSITCASIVNMWIRKFGVERKMQRVKRSVVRKKRSRENAPTENGSPLKRTREVLPVLEKANSVDDEPRLVSELTEETITEDTINYRNDSDSKRKALLDENTIRNMVTDQDSCRDEFSMSEGFSQSKASTKTSQVRTVTVRGGDLQNTSGSSFQAITSRKTEKVTRRQDLELEAMELVEIINETSVIFERGGLDPKKAQDFVLQRHISDLQEKSRRDFENEKLAVEMKLRSVELMHAERRHQESTAVQRMDGNWVTKCFEERNKLLSHVVSVSLYTIVAIMADDLIQSGVDTLRAELLCSCQAQESWGSYLCAINPYMCSGSVPSCWMTCCIKWAWRAVSALALRLVGMTFHHTFLLVLGFVMWKQLQVVWLKAVGIALASTVLYTLIRFRCHWVQHQMKRRLDNKELLDYYLMECDYTNLGISFLMLTVFITHQVVEGGYLLSMIRKSLAY